MRLLLLSHEACLGHDAGRRHPERPERIEAVVTGIETSGHDIVSVAAPEASREHLLLNHDAAYVDEIRRASAGGGALLDPDTRVGPGTWEAALRSAGAGPAAIDALSGGAADAAFAATRPPGHHALATRAMGFCIFNNVAVTARVLTARGRRVAIIDWDVHHGNGTQDAFYRDPGVFYVSLHESAFYPGTGHAHERGAGPGRGTTMNFSLPAGTDGGVYRWLMQWAIRPAVSRHAPDWLLVSAGYDAHRRDPLAHMMLEAQDYAAMAGVVRDLVPPGRIVLFLEGGYDLDALASSARATVRGLAGDGPPLPGRDETGASPAWRLALRTTADWQREAGQGDGGGADTWN